MLNFKEKNKVYITSDTHFHHNRDFVWKSRGFSSVIEHDNALISKINERVKCDDILIHLGDFCLNTNASQFEELLTRINCQNIYMLFGNHPNPHYKNVYKPLVKSLLKSEYTDDSEMYPLRYRNVVYIGHYAEVVIGGQFIVLSHYPIYVWNEMQHGAWMLCGHSHGGCPFSCPDNINNKILDCGWDLHKTPLSFGELQEIMDKKGFVAMDNHHLPSISPSNPLVMTGLSGAKLSAS